MTVPVLDPALCDRLDEILRTALEDDELAWTLRADGSWSKVPTVAGLSAQDRLMELARRRVGSS